MNPKKTTTDKTPGKDSTTTGNTNPYKTLKTQSTIKETTDKKSTIKTIGKTITDTIIKKDVITNNQIKKTNITDDKKHQRNISEITTSKNTVEEYKTNTNTTSNINAKKGFQKVSTNQNLGSASPKKRPSVTPIKNLSNQILNNAESKNYSTNNEFQSEIQNLEENINSSNSIDNFNLDKEKGSSGNLSTLSVVNINLNMDKENLNSNHSGSVSTTSINYNTTNTNYNNTNNNNSSQNFNFSTSTATDELKIQLSLKEQELSQFKKVLSEKKDLQELLLIAKKERDDWHKKFEEGDSMVNTCLKELEDYSKQIESLMKTKDELENKLFLTNDDSLRIKKENEVLNNKISDFEIEIEIKKEEIEFYKIELESVNLNLDNANKTNQNNELNQMSQITNLDENEMGSKLIELESQVKKLTNTLIRVTEDRNSEAAYYKKEMEILNEKLRESDKNLLEIHKRDDLIKNLNKKIYDQDSHINDLKDQLTALNSASNMLDDLITQKTQLEIDYTCEKEENQILKGEMETVELLIQELENASKISNDIVREKENEILEINNKISIFKIKIEENDSKEAKLVNIIQDLKMQNKIIREEISKNENLNVDDILNRNLNQNSRLKTLQRQKVLNILSLIDIGKMNLRNKIISQMIPKKTFIKGYIESFDKFLLIQSLRKKTLNIIFNIIENDLLNDENNNEISLDDENNKTLINFLKNALQTLIDFNHFLLNIEILISTFSHEQFKNISDNLKNNIFTNISAAQQFIDNLISLIKDDSFGVNYQFEGLKIIVKTLNDEFKNYMNSLNIEENNFKNNFPILQYNQEMLNYIFIMLISYKMDKINLIVKNKSAIEKINFKELIKNFSNVYKQFKKTLKKVDEKFFSFINYEDSRKIFDKENTYFVKLVTNGRNQFMDEITEDNFYHKYDNLIDVMSKFCVVVLSFIEKYEKENNLLNEKNEKNKNNENNNDYDNVKNINTNLPIWWTITQEIYQELESNLKIKEEFDEANNKLKQFKLEKLELESKIEELIKNKTVNDRKFGEALIQAGKVAQLESEIEEQNKKIAKYNTTIEALVKNIEHEQDKNKELKTKLDNYLANNSGINSLKNDIRQSKRGALITPSLNNLANGANSGNPLGIKLGNNSNNFMTDSVPLLNTICELQRERKILKSKLMKDKLNELFNENSYVNRYISKNKKENLEFYEQVKENVENLNNHYKQTRKELCLPKVLDICNSREVNYEVTKKLEENKVTKMRIDYMTEVDKILIKMFGDNTLDKAFKDMIENDISRTLNYFGEKRLLVGRIKFQDKEKINKVINDQNVGISSKVIPIYISEKNLKNLNKTFMH